MDAAQRELVRSEIDRRARSEVAAHPAPTARRAVQSDRLTKRELDVLEAASDGKSNIEIGLALSLAEQTVKFHLSNVYRKLDVRNRAEAIVEAARRGIVHVNGSCPVCGKDNPDVVVTVNGAEYVRAES